MEDIIIRAATLADIEQLKEFEQGVIKAERPFDPELNPDPVCYYDLEQLIKQDNCYLAVAESSGDKQQNRLVGCGYARIEKAKPYVNYRFFSYLGFMYVEPAFRGQGINQLVINYLANWSAEQGVTMLHLDVFAENVAAIRAYQKVGFNARLVEMRCDIAKNMGN